MNEMTLEINGTQYSGFISATASKSMEDISGSYTFNISILDNLQKFPIKNKSECRVLVNDKPFMTGFVEIVSPSYDAASHQISITGRDKTSDVIDSTLGDTLTFSAGISLQGIVEEVLKNLGLDKTISVSSNVDDLDIFD
jgi:prophage tail gpP-like protein